MVKKIKFKGGFFTEETEINLFDDGHRISLLYGKNGAGKSTLSKAVQKAKGDIVEDIIEANLYDENEKLFTDVQAIHVFNEEYVNSRVKIREDGLNTIVLLGDLGNVEDKISDIKLKVEAEKNKNISLRENKEEYVDKNNKKSLIYCKSQIVSGLSGDGHWAEREKNINDLKRNAAVTEKVIDSIVSLSPTEKLIELRRRYDDTLKLLDQVRKNEAAQIKDIAKLNIDYDEKKLITLLTQKVESPILSERERYLLQLIEKGKIEQLNEMRQIFSNVDTKKCPFCLREISDDVKQELIKSIEKVLSKEVDIHKINLSKCIIPEIGMDFSGLEVLKSDNCEKCRKAIEDINREILRIDEVISEKINLPYTPIENFKSELPEKLEQYEIVRGKLQQEIDTYNDAVKRIGTLKKELCNDNAAIAYYEVLRDIELWKEALEGQKKVEKALKESDEKIKNLNQELNSLISQKKNIKIAVNLINRSLKYVFFSNTRLEIKVENDKYVLYAYGKSVKPNNVSVGERNIIALCYFFTELIMNQEVKDGYAKKMVLVIDDPVSSFDFENKIGIMSLIRSKVSEIIHNNDESQIIIMTHDLQCMYDLEKICEDVKEEYKNNIQKNLLYVCKELNNKKITNFKYNIRNEYSELMKNIYDYACGDTENEKLNIGNSMRRVLEAFSTFVYKKGISEVSCDSTILQNINDKEYIEYFKNLMYRLVLNTDSHMKERTNAMENMDYIDVLSDEERQRTAREVICFIYLLNARHVIAHLGDAKDVKANIQKWCKDIKNLCKNDEIISQK